MVATRSCLDPTHAGYEQTLRWCVALTESSFADAGLDIS